MSVLLEVMCKAGRRGVLQDFSEAVMRFLSDARDPPLGCESAVTAPDSSSIRQGAGGCRSAGSPRKDRRAAGWDPSDDPPLRRQLRVASSSRLAFPGAPNSNDSAILLCRYMVSPPFWKLLATWRASTIS